MMIAQSRITPGDVLYDPHKDLLIVFSGHTVDDGFGQVGLFFHDQDWDDDAAESYGRVYTGWLAYKHLIRIGALE